MVTVSCAHLVDITLYMAMAILCLEYIIYLTPSFQDYNVGAYIYNIILKVRTSFQTFAAPEGFYYVQSVTSWDNGW